MTGLCFHDPEPPREVTNKPTSKTCIPRPRPASHAFPFDDHVFSGLTQRALNVRGKSVASLIFIAVTWRDRKEDTQMRERKEPPQKAPVREGVLFRGKTYMCPYGWVSTSAALRSHKSWRNTMRCLVGLIEGALSSRTVKRCNPPYTDARLTVKHGPNAPLGQ